MLSFPQSLQVPHARIPQRGPGTGTGASLPNEPDRCCEREAGVSPESPRLMLLSARGPAHTPGGVQLCPRGVAVSSVPASLSPRGWKQQPLHKVLKGLESLKPCPARRERCGVSSPLPFAGQGGGLGRVVPGLHPALTPLTVRRGEVPGWARSPAPPGTLSLHLRCPTTVFRRRLCASLFPACPAAPSRGCSRASWPLAPTPSPCWMWVKQWTVWGSPTSPCAHGLESPGGAGVSFMC